LPIDDLDRQIVAQLVADARRSYAEVGAEVGLSAPAVKRRVDRLRRDGVIVGFTALLDPCAAGGAVEAFVELYCREHTNPADIRRAVERHPQVVAAYTVTGDADALVRLRASDMDELEAVLERIHADENTDRTKSSIVLSRLLERPAALTD
jgi:DNA-binding Lrp family transcriptional regulator